MRAGTENVTGIVGMYKALQLAYENLDKHTNYILSLKQYAYDNIKKNIPHIVLHGNEDFSKSLYTVLNIGFEKSEQTELLPMLLDIDGIAVSGGSACSSGSATISHVIGALGSKAIPIRLSFSHLNTKQEIDTLLHCLNKHLTI